jgi:hypothetical protein
VALNISSCSSEPWCAALYDRATVNATQELIHASQNPANCSSARYLVLSEDWGAGLGSMLHSRAMALHAALLERRVLLYHPARFVSPWTDPRDSLPLCAQRQFECYVAPLTHCRLPPALERNASLALPWFAPNSQEQYTQSNYHFVLYRLGFREDSILPLALPGASARVRAMPGPWWMSMLMQYLLRRNDAFHAERVAPLVQRTVPANVIAHDVRFMSVFMRQGDKFKEAALHPPSEYLTWIEALTRKHALSHLYLSTDSAAALQDMLRLLSADALTKHLQVFFIDYPREANGLTMSTLKRKVWGTGNVGRLTAVALADLDISSRAFLWLGTLSSNWARLQDEVRRTKGKAGAPYFSLDDIV